MSDCGRYRHFLCPTHPVKQIILSYSRSWLISSLVTPTLSTAVKQTVLWPTAVAPRWADGSATRSPSETNHHAFEYLIAFGSHNANNVVWRLRVDSQRDNNCTEYYKLYNHKITAVDKQIWSKQIWTRKDGTSQNSKCACAQRVTTHWTNHPRGRWRGLSKRLSVLSFCSPIIGQISTCDHRFGLLNETPIS